MLLALTVLVVLAGTPNTMPMPTINEYPVLNATTMGTLSCGKAYMEVRKGQVPVTSVVVWYLNGRVLAVVFVHDGYNQAFVDWDFNGKWNYVDIQKTGEGTAREFYAKVKGCGDGWFR